MTRQELREKVIDATTRPVYGRGTDGIGTLYAARLDDDLVDAVIRVVLEAAAEVCERRSNIGGDGGYAAGWCRASFLDARDIRDLLPEGQT